jgi:hypothetical protein
MALALSDIVDCSNVATSSGSIRFSVNHNAFFENILMKQHSQLPKDKTLYTFIPQPLQNSPLAQLPLHGLGPSL